MNSGVSYRGGIIPVREPSIVGNTDSKGWSTRLHGVDPQGLRPAWFCHDNACGNSAGGNAMQYGGDPYGGSQLLNSPYADPNNYGTIYTTTNYDSNGDVIAQTTTGPGALDENYVEAAWDAAQAGGSIWYDAQIQIEGAQAPVIASTPGTIGIDGVIELSVSGNVGFWNYSSTGEINWNLIPQVGGSVDGILRPPPPGSQTLSAGQMGVYKTLSVGMQISQTPSGDLWFSPVFSVGANYPPVPAGVTTPTATGPGNSIMHMIVSSQMALEQCGICPM